MSKNINYNEKLIYLKSSVNGDSTLIYSFDWLIKQDTIIDLLYSLLSQWKIKEKEEFFYKNITETFKLKFIKPKLLDWVNQYTINVVNKYIPNWDWWGPDWDNPIDIYSVFIKDNKISISKL
jgi:hypothetical protein